MAHVAHNMGRAPLISQALTSIPLYPSEAEIAVLVLGDKRAKDWPAVAKHLENKEGLPRVDKQMGGRFWPSVEAYFRQRHGMYLLPHSGDVPPKPRMAGHIRFIPPPDVEK